MSRPLKTPPPDFPTDAPRTPAGEPARLPFISGKGCIGRGAYLARGCVSSLAFVVSLSVMTTRSALRLTASALLGFALLPLAPTALAEPDRLYEIWPEGDAGTAQDEHSATFLYKEQDGHITSITEVYAPGLRCWELRYRYDKHGNCLGAQLRHAWQSEEDAPWQYEESELGPDDRLDLPYAPQVQRVYERAGEARMRVGYYCHGRDRLRRAKAPAPVLAAWDAVVLRAPGELDELLTAHPELLQWRFFEGRTTSGVPYSQDMLSLALAEGDTRLVDVVLQHGISPNRLQRREGGENATTLDLTPLAEVVRLTTNNPEDEETGCQLLQHLVARGAEVNLPLADGATPLHLAAGQHREGILSERMFLMLLALGAKTDATNAYGETPLDLLRQNLQDRDLLPGEE